MKKYLFLFLFLALPLVSCSNEENDSFVVISYNIRQSGMAQNDGENRWDNRKDATIEMIEREAPDMFGIQEGLMNQVSYIEDKCPGYARIGVGRDDGVEGGEIMAIFYLKSRFEIMESGTFWLSQTPDEVSRGWDAACNRTLTWVHLKEKSSGKCLYYFNTHLDHIGVVAREESIKLIVQKINEIAGEDASAILGGDFNEEMTNSIFAPLKDIMINSRESSPITDQKGTFNDFKNKQSDKVIDYLLGKNVRFISFKTLDGDYGAPYISDHYPIKAVFSLSSRD